MKKKPERPPIFPASRDWIAKQGVLVCFWVAVIFLSFISGALLAVAEVAPSGYIKNAYRAGTALYQKFRQQQNIYTSNLWAPERTSKTGVTIHDPGKTQPGLTLYTSGHGPRAVLVDMDGRIVSEWHKPFSAVWDRSAAVQNPVSDRHASFTKARVFPNGDLIAIYIGTGDSPYGYGMVKLDKHSKILWKNLDHFHHDFTVTEDGTIYGLTQDFRQKPVEGVDHLEMPVMEDYVVVMTPDGKITKTVSLIDALNESDFRRLLWRVPYYSLGDPLHTNSIDILDETDAAKLGKKIPAAAAGQALLSFRELAGGSIALLDIEKQVLVWAARGPWLSQHDADILPNGNIMVFDNRGHFGAHGKSRIVEVDPSTGGIVWQYTGDKNNRLESLIRSDQQQLANGNILITESNGGRLLEITRSGEIAWEYINPVRGGPDQKRIPIVNWSQRIDPLWLSTGFYAGMQNQQTPKEVRIQ
ncbi:MAG: arylsulfotransferase family protein [Thermodesulfobacteriota bacterium]